MKKLTVLVDLDDVLNNLAGAWIGEINKKHKTSTSINDILSWEIADYFPTLTKNQVFLPLQDDNFWDSLIPRNGSVEALRKIIKDGHTVYVVTSTYYKDVKVKMEWLFKHFPYLTWDDVIITSDKKRVRGDILIDDGIHNLIDGNYYKILYDCPHNHNFDEKGNGIVRVYSWPEIYKTIKKLATDKCPYHNSDVKDDWKYCLYCKHGGDDDGEIYCRINGYGEYVENNKYYIGGIE